MRTFSPGFWCNSRRQRHKADRSPVDIFRPEARARFGREGGKDLGVLGGVQCETWDRMMCSADERHGPRLSTLAPWRPAFPLLTFLIYHISSLPRYCFSLSTSVNSWFVNSHRPTVRSLSPPNLSGARLATRECLSELQGPHIWYYLPCFPFFIHREEARQTLRRKRTATKTALN